MHRLLREAAGERQAVILNRFVFANGSDYANFRKNMTTADGPVTWLQGAAGREVKLPVASHGASLFKAKLGEANPASFRCGELRRVVSPFIPVASHRALWRRRAEISFMQARAVSGTQPRNIKIKGRETGFVYEDEYARYCHLSGIYPENLKASRSVQARDVFETMKSALEEQGFAFADTVRTWFALNRLLEWYEEFNHVRTTFFEENDVFVKMVPASTGIDAANQFGAAIICNLLAIQPKTSRLKIQSVLSPRQGSALNYQSSFSRAVELAFPTHRCLLVSGTASIAKDGKSAHAGNPALQIGLTMRVVEALLRSRNMDWNDLFRGIAYFKNMDDRIYLDKYCGDHNIPAFSLAVAHLDLCRKDLLFEIEVDAVKIAE